VRRFPGCVSSLYITLYNLSYSLPNPLEHSVLVIFSSDFQSDVQSDLSKVVLDLSIGRTLYAHSCQLCTGGA